MKNLIKTFLSLILIGCLFTCKDKCEDVNCVNGGTCEDGSCECPVQYTGEDCSEETMPSSMVIDQFFIKPYDLKLNGETWDSEVGEEGPDVYLKLLDKDNNVLLDARGFNLPNVTSSFTLNYDWVITNVTELHTVQIIDEDDDMNDDLIFEYTFQPYTAGQNFPETIEKIFSADGIPPTEDGELRLIVREYDF